ncbi:MAG TPA: Rne/Rng family ribonuclease [Gammaproteobacteria bacterium]|nr:Rne/Rng family ribonuclease [Gammaproteobacteria bacterium]
MAMVDGQKLYDLDVETPSREQRKANIYKGRITRIEPSLEAAFIDYGAQRHGFLPLKEISPEYFIREPEGDRIQIKEVLRENQEIVVQVDKEERGTKGAALTTYVSLAGRFLVLMPNNPRAGGVSRRITGEDRDIVRQSLDELNPPDGMGCIVRTAGVGRSTEELRWDLDYLLKVWESIKSVVVTRPAPFLIYQEGNAIVRALRDYYSTEIGEILIDDARVYQEARDFMERVLPESVRKLKLYDDETVPLFTRFQIESQIESAYAHKVQLPSGGSIVIDHTEALTAIDINSARSTKGEDIEETALNTNLEAADEVGRQLRIRDLGGLVVVDFIDMGPHRNQREVENRLREAVRHDRARIQIGRISRFGLLELSRQRLRPSLEESTQSVCPRCNGTGNVRSVESLALAILRLVGEEARKERTAKVIAQLPLDVANYLLNEKRDWVQTVQQRNGVEVVLLGNPDLDTPNYAIRRVRDDEAHLPDNAATSYKLVEPKEDPSLAYEEIKKPVRTEEAAVSGVLPETPAPQPPPPPPPTVVEKSVWQRLFGWLNGAPKAAEEESEPEGRSRRSRERRPAHGDRRNRGNGRRGRGRHDGRHEGSRLDGARAEGGRDGGRGEGRADGGRGEGRDEGGRREGGRGDGGRRESGRGDGGRGEGARGEGGRGEGGRSDAARAESRGGDVGRQESERGDGARGERQGAPRSDAGRAEGRAQGAGQGQGGGSRSRRSRNRRGRGGEHGSRESSGRRDEGRQGETNEAGAPDAAPRAAQGNGGDAPPRGGDAPPRDEGYGSSRFDAPTDSHRDTPSASPASDSAGWDDRPAAGREERDAGRADWDAGRDSPGFREDAGSGGGEGGGGRTSEGDDSGSGGRSEGSGSRNDGGGDDARAAGPVPDAPPPERAARQEAPAAVSGGSEVTTP